MHKYEAEGRDGGGGSFLNRDDWLEVAVYLTHTGIINEAGIAMQDTIGNYAYRFICMPIAAKCTLALLCSESIQTEELADFLNFQMAQRDFFKCLEAVPDIENEANANQSLMEWLYCERVSADHSVVRTYQRDPGGERGGTGGMPSYCWNSRARFVQSECTRRRRLQRQARAHAIHSIQGLRPGPHRQERRSREEALRPVSAL